MNESLDDPSYTNVPNSWRPLIAEAPSTVIQDLFTILKFDIRSDKNIKIKMLASQCLAHLANLKQSIFESVETRIIYVTLLVNELTTYLNALNQS